MPLPIILIVDDGPENLTVLGELLQDRYQVRAANSGSRGLQLASMAPLPDMILLDVMMPDLDGFEVLRRLQADECTRRIPVIFTTAMNDTVDEERGLELGAVDYITKPLRPSVVLARVQAHLALKRERDMLRTDNAMLGAQVSQQLCETLLIQDVALRAMARLAETRDNETGNHLLRTQRYVQLLARLAGAHADFSDRLDERTISLIAKSAPLHDIGKVGIPDRVLLKPGKLDAEEWAIMKSHARLGAEAIARAVADTRQPVAFLFHAEQIAMHHHERWDGSGYPDMLAGEDIPLSARLMAIADVFDALISPRVYKAPLSFAQARSLMASESGRHFDPKLLAIFLASFDEFCDIARCHPDEHAAACAASTQPPVPAAC